MSGETPSFLSTGVRPYRRCISYTCYMPRTLALYQTHALRIRHTRSISNTRAPYQTHALRIKHTCSVSNTRAPYQTHVVHYGINSRSTDP